MQQVRRLLWLYVNDRGELTQQGDSCAALH